MRTTFLQATAIFLLLCMLSSTAPAQNEIIVSTELAIPGGQRAVSVSMSTDDPISAMDFVIEYDPGLLAPAAIAPEDTLFAILDVELAFISIVVDPDESTIDFGATFELDTNVVFLPEAVSLQFMEIIFELPIVPANFGLLPVSVQDGAEYTIEDPATGGDLIVDANGVPGGIFLLDPGPPPFPFEDSCYIIGEDNLSIVEINPATGELELLTDPPILIGATGLAQAVGKDGSVWVTTTGPAQLRSFDGLGGEQITIDLDNDPGPIAVNNLAMPWVAIDDSLWLFGRSGELIFGDTPVGPGGLGTSIKLGGTLRCLHPIPPRYGDPGVWGIATGDGAASGQLFRVSFQGALVVDVPVDVGADSCLAVDPLGRVWVSTTTGVELRRSDGTLQETFDLGAGTQPGKLALASTNTCYTLEFTSGEVYRLTPGQDPELIYDEVLEPSGISIAGNGFVYVTGDDAVVVLDPNIADLPIVDPPLIDLTYPGFICGDATGFAAALTACPGGPGTLLDGDFDDDGVLNGPEIRDGGNPLDGGIVPPIQSIDDLRCQVVEQLPPSGTFDVELSWVPPQDYDTVELFRDGNLLETFDDVLAGTLEIYLDTPGDGIFQYELTASDVGGGNAIPARCRVAVGAGQILREYRITDTNNDLGPPRDLSFADNEDTGLNLLGIGDSVTSWASFSGGTIVGYDSSNVPIVTFTGPFPMPSGIAYIAWGDSGNGSVLVADGDAGSPGQIIEVSLSGAALTGRDSGTLGTSDVGDIMAPIQSLSVTGTSLGDGIIFATAPDFCEVLAFRYDTMELYEDLTFEHPGADGAGYHGQGGCAAGGSSGTGSITITGLMGTGSASADVFLTVLDEFDQLFVRQYQIADGEPTEVGIPIPIVGPTDTDDSFLGIDISETIPRTATIIGSSSRLYDVAAPTLGFLRGDADGNGEIFAIIDALYVLEYGFNGGPVPPCLDAADADDSGNIFAILDALVILEYGFTNGPEPPDPGPLECGPDPTTDFDDLVGCNFYECPDTD